MGDLVAFLRARLDEDHQVAQSAAGATWAIGQTKKVEWGPVEPWTEGTAVDSQGQRWPQTWTDTHSHICASAPDKRMVADMSDHSIRSRNVANAEHISRWDPARMLAEVEAKRQIIELCQDCIDAGEIQPRTTWNDDAAGMMLGWRVLRQMAMPYADHSDYDPAWTAAVAGT